MSFYDIPELKQPLYFVFCILIECGRFERLHAEESAARSKAESQLTAVRAFQKTFDAHVTRQQELEMRVTDLSAKLVESEAREANAAKVSRRNE